MNKINPRKLILLNVSVALVAILIWMVTSDVYAVKYPYKATLSAQNEVPPVKSIATGQAEFTVPANGIIKYRVNITGISNASGAHIHTGTEGQNGDVVADLLYTPTSQQKDTAYGMIFRGNLDDSSLKGPMQGKSIDDLGAAMNSGEIYLNVQTTEHPDGEIRDQLSNSDKFPNVEVRPDTLSAQSDIKSQIEKELSDPSNKISDTAVVLIYSDTSWSGSILDSSLDSATRDGSGNSKIFIKCTSNGIYSLALQKQTDYGYVLVSIIQDGNLLDSKATSAQYGVVSLAGNCAQ